MRLVAEQLTDPLSHHAEGPLWDERSSTLLWVDQYRRLVRSASLDDGGRGRARLGEPIDVGALVGAVVPRERGGWMLAAGDGFVAMASDGTVEPTVSVLEDDGLARRMNDGKVDPLGRFWAGSMAIDKTPGAGALHVLIDGEARTVLRGATIPNGMAWSPDGRELYYIDTPLRSVQRFAVASDGSLSDGETVIRIGDGEGEPDGMSIDAEGMLWVALWGGRAVQRYRPDGALIGRIDVSATQVSSCAFGGADRSTLFITTSREDYDDARLAADPNAGALFSVRPGVSAPAAAAYAG